MDELMQKLEELKRLTLIGAKDMLTIEELSYYTGFSIDYIYSLTHKKLIPYYKPSGKKIYFDKAEINDWMHQNKSIALQEAERLAELASLMTI